MPTSLLVPGERCSCDCQLQPQLCGKPVGRASNLIFGASHIWVDQSRIQQGFAGCETAFGTPFPPRDSLGLPGLPVTATLPPDVFTGAQESER